MIKPDFSGVSFSFANLPTTKDLVKSLKSIKLSVEDTKKHVPGVKESVELYNKLSKNTSTLVKEAQKSVSKTASTLYNNAQKGYKDHMDLVNLAKKMDTKEVQQALNIKKGYIEKGMYSGE